MYKFVYRYGFSKCSMRSQKSHRAFTITNRENEVNNIADIYALVRKPVDVLIDVVEINEEPSKVGEVRKRKTLSGKLRKWMKNGRCLTQNVIK